MEVVVVGAGLMGSQIAAEYALGGHRVQCYARNPETTRTRLEEAFATVLRLELHDEALTMEAAEGVTVDRCAGRDRALRPRGRVGAGGPARSRARC